MAHGVYAYQQELLMRNWAVTKRSELKTRTVWNVALYAAETWTLPLAKASKRASHGL